MLLEMNNICKIYHMGDSDLRVLNNVCFKVKEVEFVSIIGPSGSGKSTLMNMIGCLDVPSSGEYLLEGRDVSQLSQDEQATIRNEKIGFIFQGFNLLPKLTALENVELPLLYRNTPAGERRRLAMEALEKVADGKATKLIIPSEIQGLAGLAASAKTILSDDKPEA